MTTIAYRDGVLASDSLVSSGNTRAGEVRKIARHGNLMGGISGPLDAAEKFLRWIESGCEGDCPQLGDGSDAILIRGRKTFYVGPSGTVVPFRAPFAATGSGENLAIGAMAMGASAIEAVKVAIRFDEGSGGRIASLTLEA